ncbi:MAG TPA: D-alanine--D-alanine ligase [Polyangiaceae bacterium]|nr:D-alanine--D-alanine ligase [Polyangiaceae bacterium]
MTARAPGRLSVAVVQGGPSTEAEVSRASAEGVQRALSQAGHRVVRLELDERLPESLRTGGYDVVFPVAHGAVGEDGSLQGLLEVLELPYVGSGVLASALAMHKRVARVLFAGAGLPVARGIALRRADARAAADRALREVGARLVVKPSSQGSAIGVTRLDERASPGEVAAAIEAVWAIDEFAVIEHFARGREVTCGVLDLDSPVALPPTEVLSPNDPFYTYEARYAPGRSVHVCPARLPDDVLHAVQRVAVAAHTVLGCRDLCRVDFVVGDVDAIGSEGAPGAASAAESALTRLTLLEVNTLPGMTATSLYPEAASAHGLTMPSLCDSLVLHAHARGATRRPAARPLPR